MIKTRVYIRTSYVLYEFTQDTFSFPTEIHSGRSKLFEPYQTEWLVRLYTLPSSFSLSLLYLRGFEVLS